MKSVERAIAGPYCLRMSLKYTQVVPRHLPYHRQ